MQYCQPLSAKFAALLEVLLPVLRRYLSFAVAIAVASSRESTCVDHLARKSMPITHSLVAVSDTSYVILAPIAVVVVLLVQQSNNGVN
jgi:hypothetical protein